MNQDKITTEQRTINALEQRLFTATAQTKIAFEDRNKFADKLSEKEKEFEKLKSDKKVDKTIAIILCSLFFFTTAFFFLHHEASSSKVEALEKEHNDLIFKKTVSNGFSLIADSIFQEKYALYPTDTLKYIVYGSGGSKFEMIITNYYKRNEY